MFEVLVFVYENYFTSEACPEPAHLERKLSAVGFDSEEIDDAIVWLEGLNSAARPPVRLPCAPGYANPAPTAFAFTRLWSATIWARNALGSSAFWSPAGCCRPTCVRW